MDKIILKGMAFYGYHGVMPQENTLGQKFFVDMELGLDLKPAGDSDDLEKSVSYALVYNLVKDIVEGTHFKLIEALGEKIASKVFETFNLVDYIKIKIRKPEAPVPGIFDYFGIELERNRVE